MEINACPEVSLDLVEIAGNLTQIAIALE